MSGSEGRNPYEDYLIIKNELKQFNENLLKRPEIIIANKMDIENAKENLKEFKKKVKKVKIFEVSAITNDGLDIVMEKIADLLDTLPKEELYKDEKFESYVLYKFKKEEPYTIIKEMIFGLLKEKKLKNYCK